MYSGDAQGGAVAPCVRERKAMALSSRDRRELAQRGHHLAAVVTIAAGPVSDATVAHVRQALTKHDLIKVRFATDDRGEFQASAQELTRRVACELVQTVGRTALLYQPAPIADPTTGA